MAACLLGLGLLASLAQGLRFDPAQVEFNLNQNQSATNPLDYWGERNGHTFTPSPKNWRFPFYTLFLDRFVNGDPVNDNANGTVFEQDITSTQLRHGGDMQGLIDSLDYIQGMGIKGLYIAGSPFINAPWGSDSYSPLDLTLLDFHYGNIAKWREAIDEIHRRGMYVVLDHTMSTMGDLIGFDGFLNVSTPFDQNEHKVLYKGSRQYLDFQISNEYNETCQYPRFWDETGKIVGPDVTGLKGCFNSDFDQYGDTEAFGVFPDWQRQLSKFASVQDRLREWHTPVRERLERFTCIEIAMLDVDGFRFDKATQITVDAMANFADTVRGCARKLGKENFFMPGEITGGNTFGSIYIGRGREPQMQPKTLSEALNLTNKSPQRFFIREEQKVALDAGAFHYSVYRFLTRFLGMSGNLEAGFDLPPNWVDAWNGILLSNDLVNVNTGELDVRHMYGISNQDVFRWPTIKQGVERQLLGTFITTLHMPGIPKVFYGEEQAFYVLDSTAENYIFGRQAMSPSPAWHLHGCYARSSSQYKNWPIEQGRKGCEDETVSFDHRDPSHPVHNIMKSMYHMRESYPALVDGLLLQKLGNQTFSIILDGSNVTATEFGVWSVARGFFPVKQDDELKRNTNIWLVYHNQDTDKEYSFDCSTRDESKQFIAPFDAGSRVKNLFFPFDEITLESSQFRLGFNGSRRNNGCVSKLQMKPFEYRAYVPVQLWVGPQPMITKFTPGHDARLRSTSTVPISFHFNTEMDCNRMTRAVTVKSVTENGSTAKIDTGSVRCAPVVNERPNLVGGIPSTWSWSATLTDVADGIHEIIVTNATTNGTSASGTSTKSVDHFYLRVGQPENPVVFPLSANYSNTLVSRDSDNNLVVSHKAAGATQWRYSTNWGSSWSDWLPYKGGQEKIEVLPWSGTPRQAWQGDHVIAQYFSRTLGSSSMIQEGDFGINTDRPRRFPHLFAHGVFNKFGFDAGIRNELKQRDDGKWELHYMAEWPDKFQFNVWGINPDKRPDTTFVFGDVDADLVMDRISPASLLENVVNVTDSPPAPFLSFKMVLDDTNLSFELQPTGNRWLQIILFIILAAAPLMTAMLAVWIFRGAFYKIKVVKIGAKQGQRRGRSPFRKYANRLSSISFENFHAPSRERVDTHADIEMGVMAPAGEKRRTVLIATMEYNIDDWNIKIKIGGLGVMAQLMGKALEHQDLIWVVPCVGDVDYPVDELAEPMYVTIMGKEYEIGVQYHRVANITYVLLDSDVFRQQTKADPYPARMDDIESAVYYSAWNQAIAETSRRFPVDLYHINDYHGAIAPLYLLPQTIPCCLSLHNAEFQGLWPMRDPKEKKEVCEVFNLDQKVVEDYVQFGSVFNLLHAGASILRKHQRGFGAVGVSAKYGERSFARYPIFWGLKKIGQLPNPDPTDTAEWNKDEVLKKEDVVVDEEFEAGRADLRRQAQEWAGLEVNPKADLFVFVGRWSLQKGVDLIADLFPSVLEKNPNTQLICIGPVIDLYGKFAALKLSKLMEKYPKRVFSKPEFTSLPPYIFSGAEFALIPSRDEPFGLVAVEFGRKGALGVGARVGGLGQMPGFWYTIESTQSHHLIRQFKGAIESALSTNDKTRAKMRAWSAKQRFPVAQWLEQLEELQSTSIRIHDKEAKGTRGLASSSQLSIPGTESGRRHSRSPSMSGYFGENGPDDGEFTPPYYSGAQSANNSPRASRASSLSLPFLPPPPALPATTSSHRDSISSVHTITPGPRGHTRNFSTTSVDSLAVPEPRFGASVEPTAEMRPNYPYMNEGQSASRLSVYNVVGERDDFKLQKVDPFFTDSTGEFYKAFEKRLDGLTAKNSDTDLCIEDYLNKSEKEWFGRFRNAKLGRDHSASRNPSPTGSRLKKNRYSLLSRPVSTASSNSSEVDANELREELRDPGNDRDDEFLLGSGYKPPKGLKKYLQIRVGDWPVYSFLLAFGQIIAANSYQIVLLTGERGQTPEKLYMVAGTYLGASICWWILLRFVKSVYALSLPFLFYGLAFVMLGISPFIPSFTGRGAVQDAATAVYAFAAASGALFFALNFGDEGGSDTKVWIFRACVIQGIAQMYVVALWYWGSLIESEAIAVQISGVNIGNSPIPKILVITVPIAILLWIVGVVIFIGLPDYYRQSPDKIPAFYRSLVRRRIVPWFFVAVIIQNYFLSAPYGRNWEFLFMSQHLPTWSILLLAAVFFVGVWAVVFWAFSGVGKSHPWLLPIFAIGLGAPRWAQMLWGTSGVGLYLPWAGPAWLGALISRILWLWLGLLDSVQGVGIGMILLTTLTRMHVAAGLIGAQVLGSIATIAAKASAPNKDGPGDVFPDFSEGVMPGISKPWFWIVLILQLVICLGFFKFFRKEQVAKP